MTPEGLRKSRCYRSRKTVSERSVLRRPRDRLIPLKLRGRINRYKPYHGHRGGCSLCLQRAVDMRLTEMFARAPRPWGVVLCLAVGCSHRTCFSSQQLAERIVPPPDVVQASAKPEIVPQQSVPSGNEQKTTGEPPPAADSGSQPLASDGVPSRPLTLADAIAMAFRLQPPLSAS